MQRGQRVVVIQLEPLDEAGVHHGRRRGAGSPAAPADQCGIPGVIERRDALHANAGPGQLRTYQGTADAVQHQVLGPVADGGGNVVERCVSDPGGKPAGRAGRVGGGTGWLSRVLDGGGCFGSRHGISSFASVVLALRLVLGLVQVQGGPFSPPVHWVAPARCPPD
jgi:hypothetical protein